MGASLFFSVVNNVVIISHIFYLTDFVLLFLNMMFILRFAEFKMSVAYLFVCLKAYRTLSGDKERFNERMIELASRPKQEPKAAEAVGK